MRRLIGALLALAACAPAPPPDVLFYRDTAVPISSIALFEPARFAGRWFEVARYQTGAQGGCRDVSLDVARPDDGALALSRRCLAPGAGTAILGRAVPAGPGRLEVDFDAAPQISGSYWVLWVDEGYRTAVIGTPSGRFGFVLDRSPEIPDDRFEAARRLLEFNGYDLARLRTD